MSIEASDVAAAILKTLPECTAIVDAHLEEWPGEPIEEPMICAKKR
jgi:hypothetical protein